MKKTIQLVGAISNAPGKNINEFLKVQKFYEKLGYEVINPHDIATALAIRYECDGLPEPDEKAIIAYCLISLLTEADLAIVVGEIKNSAGAPVELHICKAYDIEAREAYTDKLIDISAGIQLNYSNCKNMLSLVLESSEINTIDFRYECTGNEKTVRLN